MVLRRLVEVFASEPEVSLPAERPGKFGSRGLRVGERVFAMEVRGALALKLPANTVDALVAAGEGARLTMGQRAMREWVVLACDPARSEALAREALCYVRGE